MSRIKPKRRWLQFSLRSVLLLTLAVALWLGYEVRQARHVERTIQALRALGGDAECEPTGWSLLRLCRVPGYGQRIVGAQIPGTAVEEGIGLLRELRDRCDLEVIYDGTFEPTPSWRRVTNALGTSIRPRGREPAETVPLSEKDRWKASPKARMLARIRARMVDAYPQTREFWRESTYYSWVFEHFKYQLLFLRMEGLPNC